VRICVVGLNADVGAISFYNNRGGAQSPHSSTVKTEIPIVAKVITILKTFGKGSGDCTCVIFWCGDIVAVRGERKNFNTFCGI